MKRNIKDEINYKYLCSGLIFMLIGILFIVGDEFLFKSHSQLGISIGCSLLASGVIVFVNTFGVEKKPYDPLREWGIKEIFPSRSDSNKVADVCLEKAKEHVDGIAFGLRSFREEKSDEIENRLRRGVDFRILTMNPDSEFVKFRAVEEGQQANISQSIKDLVVWADKLNAKNYKGKIFIKGYTAMTLDFYWRVDDVIFVGPYLYGRESQRMITYQFNKGGVGFKYYEDYFDQLWCDKKLCKYLTQKVRMRH